MRQTTSARELFDRIGALIRRHDAVNWALLDQTLISGVNFLTTILIARFLGPEELSRFALAWLIVLFAVAVHASLIIWPMMSIGPKQARDEVPAYYGAVLSQHILYSLISFPILLAVLSFMAAVVPEWRLDGLALPATCAVIMVQSQDSLRRYFFTRDRGRAAFINDGVRYLGQVGILASLLLTTSMDSAATLWTIAACAGIATLFAALAMESVRFQATAFLSAVVRHWQFGKSLAASAVIGGLAGNIVYFIAGALLGTKAIGVIQSSYTIMGLSNIIYFGLANVALVRAAVLFHKGGAAVMTPYLLRIAWLLFGATSILAVAAAVAPEFWLDLFFGADYAAHGHLLRWWAAIYLVENMMLPLEAGLRAMEKTRPALTAELWRLLLALLILYPLVAVLGESGAMLGFLLLVSAKNLVLAIALKRRLAMA